MKAVFDVFRHPLVIGAFVLGLLIVIGSYFGSHWYYADFAPEQISMELPVQVKSAPPPADPSLSNNDFLEVESEVVSPVDVDTTETEVEIALKDLTDAEIRSILEEAGVVVEPLPRESPFGLGIYPTVPSDWPRPDVWDVLEQDYKAGYATIEHELIQRVLIKLWKQGKQTDSGIVEDGLVYPLYTDTIYIRWAEEENPDGSTYRYVSEVLCHESLAHHDEDIDQGIMPSGIKVIEQDGAGIDPYPFLGLP